MKAMLFYERLVPLDRVRHAALRLAPAPGPSLCDTNSLPLLSSELPAAARSFPVVFAQLADGVIAPIALLGLRPGQNLFSVGEVGVEWEGGRHVPAFARRYPFVLDSDLNVLIDEDYPGFGAEEGERLFEADGSDGPALRHALAFLRGYEDEQGRTRVFVETLVTHDLLVASTITVSPAEGAPFTLEDVLLVDEARLATLPDAALAELTRSGAMLLIHAHRVSLGWLDELNRRRAEREETMFPDARATPDEPAAAAVPASDAPPPTIDHEDEAPGGIDAPAETEDHH